MTIVGLDDTDSRTLGMCTTYAAAQVADRHAVERLLLVRCNPAVEYKTRGNAALAVHTDADPERARRVLDDILSMAETDDPQTNPGGIVADSSPDAIPDAVGEFADSAVQSHLDIDQARNVAKTAGFETREVGNGRGLIGALAAIGAWVAHDDWTYEHIAYRERERWGTDREIDFDSVFAAIRRTPPVSSPRRRSSPANRRPRRARPRRWRRSAP